MMEFGEFVPPIVENRAQMYSELFEGELDCTALSEYLGIASLRRVTANNGHRSDKLHECIEQTDMLVREVLHVQGKGGEHAVLSFVNRENEELVADVVSDIFATWQVSLDRHKLPPIFQDREDTEVQGLVIETAAAVLAINSPAVNGVDLCKNQSDRVKAVKLIGARGPDFATRWLNGEIIKKWAIDREMKEPEVEEFMRLMTPSWRKRIGAQYAADPLLALSRVEDNFANILSHENIAKRLDWPIEEVRDLFTSTMRKHLAVMNINKPLKAVDKITENMDELLSTPRLADELGWTPDRIDEVFSQADRKRIALHNIKDPISAAKRIKHIFECEISYEKISQELAIPEQDARNLLTLSVRRLFAFRFPTDPLGAIKLWMKGELDVQRKYDARRDKYVVAASDPYLLVA